jgi:hypothetical protein
MSGLTVHIEKHPLAGKEVKLKCLNDRIGLNGSRFIIEDWQSNVFGKSWMFCDGNPAALQYAVRLVMAGLPIDNNVVYGHSAETGLGHIIHVSEIVEEAHES